MYVLFGILFIRFRHQQVDLQQFFGDISILQVSKFNRNYATKFHKCSGKNVLLYNYQKMFLKIRKELVKHSVVLGCLFNKSSITLEENSCRRNYFLDSKQLVQEI